jgi:chorismate mutase
MVQYRQLEAYDVYKDVYDDERILDQRIHLLRLWLRLLLRRRSCAGSSRHAESIIHSRQGIKSVGFQPHALFVYVMPGQTGGAMTLRGIRGATTASANSRDAILSATVELMRALIEANRLTAGEVPSVYLTTTPDLTAAFAGEAVRTLGWGEVAVLDAQAPAIAGDVPHCIRVLIHWDTDHAHSEIRHIYLRGARVLRPDRAGD